MNAGFSLLPCLDYWSIALKASGFGHRAVTVAIQPDTSEWLTDLLIAAALIVPGLIASSIADAVHKRRVYRRATERAARHMAGRTSRTFQELANEFFAGEERDIAVVVMEQLQNYLDVDLTQLHPDDDLIEEIGLGSFNFLETLSLLQDIGEVFQVEISESFSDWTLREITAHVAELKSQPRQ